MAIASTGDELVDPVEGSVLGRGQVRGLLLSLPMTLFGMVGSHKVYQAALTCRVYPCDLLEKEQSNPHIYSGLRCCACIVESSNW